MFKRFFKFLKNVKQEMAYVTWPTKEDLKEGTTVVIFMAILVGIFLAIVDATFSILVRTILLKG